MILKTSKNQQRGKDTLQFEPPLALWPAGGAKSSWRSSFSLPYQSQKSTRALVFNPRSSFFLTDDSVSGVFNPVVDSCYYRYMHDFCNLIKQ